MSARGFPSGGIASGQGAMPWFGFELAARLARIQLAHLGAILDIQTRTIDAGIAAFSINQADLFSTLANRTQPPRWVKFREENAAAWAELAASWFHEVAKTQAAMLEAFGWALAAPYRPPHWPPPLWAGVAPERRRRSTVIKFPDRRRTTGYASGQR